VSGVDYAPHRRIRRGRLRKNVTRAWEVVVVRLFRSASAVLTRIPVGVSGPVARALFRVGYHLWPQKRAIIHRNAAHVLGLAPSDPRVGRLARGIYGSYARFALELIRLPGLPADEPSRLFRTEGPQHDAFMAVWERCRAGGQGIIVVSGHIGSIEVFAGAYARLGIPTYGLADDSTFPELFDTLNRSRARWGVTIIPWRRLRDIFRVMRTPAVLGMVVDWGYRPDDLPVRLMGAWTTLPAGPATLAARTGALIVPVAAIRGRDGRYRPEMGTPIEVADTSPKAIADATQAIADALEAMVRIAPEQWHTFKPMWPATQAESLSLEARARGVVPSA
jgi:KDO2-lipid IV(A) lauroyltransferase